VPPGVCEIPADGSRAIGGPSRRFRLAGVRSIELVLALLVVAGLTYFGFIAVGDEFPLNVAVATLAFVVATGLVLRMSGGGPR